MANSNTTNNGLGIRRVSDPETGETNTIHTVQSYDVNTARAAEKTEEEMSFRTAINTDKRLILYSLGFSGTIIMEGYGFALITYLFSSHNFKQKYGVDGIGQHQERDIEYIWKALLPLMAQFGSIIMLAVVGAFVCMPFFAPTVQILMAGFLLQGIPWGVFQVVSPAYASEVASLKLRPILTTWNNLCWVIGQLLAAAITKAFEKYPGDMSFRIPFAFQWVFVSLLSIHIALAPESPYWYLKNKRIPEARNAIKKLVRKGDETLVGNKLALMQHTMNQEESRNGDLSDSTSFQRFLGMFKGADARRTEIACVAWLIQAQCGSSIIPWAPKLFESAGLDASRALSVNIALPAAGILGTMGSWWLMQKWGRRQIYFCGLLVMAVFLVACGLASLAAPTIAGWAAGGILTGYTAIYDLTIGPLCYSIVSEIPSISRRAATMAAARGCYLLAGLVNHFLTPKMVGMDEDSWKWGAKTGFLYAALCVLSAVYTWYRIPETKDISARVLDILFQKQTPARKFESRAAEVKIDENAESDAQTSDAGSSRASVFLHEVMSTEKEKTDTQMSRQFGFEPTYDNVWLYLVPYFVFSLIAVAVSIEAELDVFLAVPPKAFEERSAKIVNRNCPVIIKLWLSVCGVGVISGLFVPRFCPDERL
ncbi:hypothetical protein B0H63DRAFT_452717 [Podospora didyma]|uniref:Maltose permease n=1 Tax=Podospora didyma TaxID=330526 RepID=A0AAE0KDL0_9PEZI|nr:hypothetical protein B0H63DRAFT_452717 [Podospora didyma]